MRAAGCQQIQGFLFSKPLRPGEVTELLRKRGVVDEQLRSGMMNLVIWVFFPALVLSKVSHNEALKDDARWRIPEALFSGEK